MSKMYSNIKEFYGIIEILDKRCRDTAMDLRKNLLRIRTDEAQTDDERAIMDAMLEDVSRAIYHYSHLHDLNNSMLHTVERERFFNVVGDDVVEVPRDQYIGSLEDETATIQ